MRVQFEARAVDQLRAAHAWWRANRPAAPDLLVQEIAGVVSRIEAGELPGTYYASRTVLGVRRALCSRTRYHVYYVVDDGANLAWILAIWGGQRGRGPTLKPPSK